MGHFSHMNILFSYNNFYKGMYLSSMVSIVGEPEIYPLFTLRYLNGWLKIEYPL